MFGKWCRPGYNSVVATFCHNIANDLPVSIRDESFSLPLVYIDDVIDCLIGTMEGHTVPDAQNPGYFSIHPVYEITLGELANTLRGFRDSRTTLTVPHQGDALTKKLYSAYLSYLEPHHGFSYPLAMGGTSSIHSFKSVYYMVKVCLALIVYRLSFSKRDRLR